MITNGGREMRFGSLSTFWKSVVVLLFFWVAVALTGILAFGFFLSSMRASNAESRATGVKTDAELLGERLAIPRDGERPVQANIYVPDNASDAPLPVLVNFHGGGFVLGDADEMDSQAHYWSNDWNLIVVSVNYTKPDVESVGYGVEEGVDTVKYLVENADEYGVDVDNVHVIGHSAGGYYAAQVANELEADGVPLTSQILVAPWTNGLPDSVEPDVAPALFVLAGDDPISQRSVSYRRTLKAAGVPVEVKEYPGGLHPFISTPYPELSATMSQSDKDVFITNDQKQLARQAEADIQEWIDQYRT